MVKKASIVSEMMLYRSGEAWGGTKVSNTGQSVQNVGLGGWGGCAGLKIASAQAIYYELISTTNSK